MIGSGSEHSSSYTTPNISPQSSSQILLTLAIGGFLVLYGVFLFVTQLSANPFILYFAGMFGLYPFRRDYTIIRRLMALLTLTFVLWLVRELAALFVPFIVAFGLAYLLDPAVRFLRTKKIPRTLSAFVFVLLFVGIVAAIAIFIFPVIFSQLNDIIRELSTIINNAINYLESRQFFRLLSSYGLNSPETRNLINKEVIPRLEGLLESVFRGMLSFLTSVSNVVSQILTLIVTPLLLFYFLSDFDKFKHLIVTMLEGKNDKVLSDLRRINRIVQAYLAGQAIAAVTIAVAASLIFAAFQIPYAGVLGAVCGLLNPLPYIGMAASIIVGFITIAVVGYADTMLMSMVVVVATVIGLHLLDNYVIQPRLVGSRVGLHPLMLISSLFVFGHFFGILGLLVAVPTTASMLMFFHDWIRQKSSALTQLVEQPSESTVEPSSKAQRSEVQGFVLSSER